MNGLLATATRAVLAARAAAGAIAAVLVPLSGGAPAVAGEPRYFTEGPYLVREIAGTIPATPRVRLETDLGTVRAQSVPGDEVRYRIRVRVRGADDAHNRERLEALVVSAATEGGLLEFRGEAPGAAARDRIEAEFAIDLPAAVREFEAITGAGPVEARGLSGRTVLATRGGNISADGIGGPLQAESRGGSIVIGTVRAAARLVTAGGMVRVTRAGDEVVAQTTGGNVTIGSAAGLVRAETGGGNIAIDSADRDVFAQTGGGAIRVGRIGGQLTAASRGGGIQVAGAGGGVRAETTGGSIVLDAIAGPIRAVTSAGNIRAGLLPGAQALFDSDLQTWQGDVTVALPPGLPLSVRAFVDAARGDSIRSDFPLTIFRDAEDTGRPVQVAEGDIAGGGPVLRIRTLGGTITILKTGGGASSPGSPTAPEKEGGP
jgi:hypothetical protein